LRRDAVLLDPAVHDVPVEVGEERLDVRRAVGLVVEEVRVLVDVERDEGRRVPDGEGVLRIADVVEEAALVPVVRRPRPAAAGHARRLEVAAPGVGRPEVPRDEVAERAVRVSPAASQMAEVELMVLDPTDREGEVDLERPELGVDLVRGGEVDVGEPAEDLVPLRDVALIQLVVRLHRRTRDPVELVHLGPQRPRRDLLESVDERGHERGAYPGSRKRSRRKEHPRWPLNCPTCRTPTTRSSRTSTPRRCVSTTTSTTGRTSRTQTRRSRGRAWPMRPSRACSRTSTPSRTTS